MKREFNYPILKQIQERWSPRAFSKEALSDEEINSILEAARYAPSSFNEQPWRFMLAKTEDDLKKMQRILMAQNKEWASKAPVLVLVLTKKNFTETNQYNYWHEFDAGCAWGYLSLQAWENGIITHAMGGFDQKAAVELFKIPAEYEPMAVIAIGKADKKENLPEELQKREKPGLRKNLNEIIFSVDEFE